MKLFSTSFGFRLSGKAVTLALAFTAVGALNTQAQIKKKLRVLFVGNSFTATNLMPNIVRDIAVTMGDTLEVDFNAPGGFTFEDHSTDPGTIGKMSLGTWNYVVLQEQSQRPAFSDTDVDKDVFPYAQDLDSMVHKFNACGRSVFFQTWGYKNGDGANCPIFPPICTYKGMDSMLARRYEQMAVANDAILSPVGAVFKYIRNTYPSIELYLGDDMHPSVAGSYAAAVTFYTVFFRRDPNMITFDFSVPPSDASLIRQAVFLTVYKNLPLYHVTEYDPTANFAATPTSLSVAFNSGASANAIGYSWDFGDGGSSSLANPTHLYAAAGTYNVTLTVDNCILEDSKTIPVTVSGSGVAEFEGKLSSVSVFPNPAQNELYVQAPATSAALSVEIVNTLGQSVWSGELKNSKLNISSLSAGMYLLRIHDLQSGSTATRRFSKN